VYLRINVSTIVGAEGDPVVITRHGRRVAALIDIAQFERLQRLDAEFAQSRAEIVAAFSHLDEQEGVALIDEAVEVARRAAGNKTAP